MSRRCHPKEAPEWPQIKMKYPVAICHDIWKGRLDSERVVGVEGTMRKLHPTSSGIHLWYSIWFHNIPAYSKYGGELVSGRGLPSASIHFHTTMWGNCLEDGTNLRAAMSGNWEISKSLSFPLSWTAAMVKNRYFAYEFQMIWVYFNSATHHHSHCNRCNSDWAKLNKHAHYCTSTLSNNDWLSGLYPFLIAANEWVKAVSGNALSRWT